MSILSVNNLSKSFYGESLFQNISFNINKGEKVCLLGRNGVGKSTLIKTILDIEEYDTGTINYANNLKFAYLSQNVISNVENTLIDEMNLVYKHILTIEKEMNVLTKQMEKTPNNEALLKKYDDLSKEYERLDGYQYEYQMNKILTIFGFSKELFTRKISSFSGGEKTRIAFAKLLLEKPDLLILDEPTNHLDIQMIQWLEGYLSKYDGTILFVSHDHYFINSVANVIYELHPNHLEKYTGNFDVYLKERKLRYEQQLGAYKRQQKEINRMETWIKKNKAKDSKATQAKDREKKLAKLERVEAPTSTQSNIKFKFEVKSMYKDLISVENLSIGYNEPLAKNINFQLHGGNKIAIIGPNGSGKTTLLNVLMKKMKPLDGIMRHHHSLRMAYFDQNQINLDPNNTVYDEIHQANLLMEQLEVRSLLARFLFKGEDVFKEVNVLSGGEKVRLSFAKLSQFKHDLMVLDEPTNHLDIDSKDVLFDALSDYDGTMLFISHDRHLIDEIATHILYFENDTFKCIEGNYQDYLKEIEKVPVVSKQVETKLDSGPKKLSNNKRMQIETRIDEVETRIDFITHAMFDEEVYQDHEKVAELTKEKEELEEELLSLYEEIM